MSEEIIKLLAEALLKDFKNEKLEETKNAQGRT